MEEIGIKLKMRIQWRWFSLGMVLAGVPFWFFLTSEVRGEDEQVLGEQVELIALPIATSLSTATPKPTLKAMASPTPTPVPSPTASVEPTPSPLPTPTPDVWSPNWLEPWFTQYAQTYGVDKNVLERLANCESHYDNDAVNGAYIGLFQFGPVTWQTYRGQMGLDASLDLRANPEEAIRTAAYVVSLVGTSKWPKCL